MGNGEKVVSYPLLLFSILLIFYLLSFVFAASFNSSVIPVTADAGLINVLLNFTVNNTETTSINITEVNITFPSYVSFVPDSNGTTASDTSFVNVSSNLIRWINTTPIGFIPNGTTKYFWFNVSIEKNTATRIASFNISTTDTSGNSNSMVVNVVIFGTVWSSPKEEFYIKPPEIFLNWTNNYQSNVTIAINNSITYQTKIEINNITTEIKGNYSQALFYGSEPTYAKCFIPPGPWQYTSTPLLVKDTSGEYINITQLMNTGDQTNFTLIHYTTCPPGRYWGTMNLRNATNAAENVNVTVTIDVPISVENELNISTGIGEFKGRLPVYATTYHSYYFNTSAIQNATGIVINLTWNNPANDLDLFLVDSYGNLKAKSIRKNSNFEELQFNYLPVGEIWEIRIYGNVSEDEDYWGYVSYTTLNITNSSAPEQQFDLINFGTMKVGDTSRVSFAIRNEGNLTFSNLTESKEVYHVDKFDSSRVPATFSFIIPKFANKIRVEINWTGDSNYTLNLYMPNGTLAGSSSNKRGNANVSKVMQEEFVETATISEGVWKIEIKNNTPTVENYTVVAKFWVNPEWWISSNYTGSGIYFNITGQPNSTYDFHFNFTIPKNATSGIYGGFLKYSGSSSVILPFKVNVSTATLLVNNSFESSTIELEDNIGFNRTGTNALILNISLSNTGNEELTFEVLSSTSLKLGDGSRYINFSYEYLPSLHPNTSSLLNITITIDTTKTNNTPGIYKGWIYFNATQAHPYPEFNLSLEVKLTDKLKVDFLGINTTDGNNIKENATIDENVTLLLEPYFANRTRIVNLLPSNFTNIYLEEGNVSHKIPINPVETSCTSPTEICKLNVTIPANKPGGQYRVYLTTTYKTNDVTLTNTTSFFPLIINNTGLWMELISYPSSLANGTSGIVNVSIKNYGPLKAIGAKIKLTPGSLLSSSTTSAGTNCDASFSANEWTFNLSAYNSSGCWIGWNITAGQTNGTTTSTFTAINGTWFPFARSSFDTIVTKPAEGIITPPSPTYIANLEFIRAEQLITVQQNSTNSTIVEIKNTGNKTLNVTFSIENINTGWYTINATSKTLEPNKIAAFKVTFNIGSVEIGDYSGKYKASSPDKTITKDFTLRILPTEQKKKEINATLEEFKLNYTQLENEIDQAKARGINVTLAEKKLSELKSKIEEAENYIAKGDYLSAFNLFNTIKLLMGETKVELEKAKEAKAKAAPLAIPWNLIVPALIGIFVAVLLIYLFWPVKSGYKPEEKRFIKEGGIAPTVRLEEIKTKKESLLSWIVRKIKGKKEEVRIPEEKTVEEKWRELYEKYKKKAV
jgi:hypothetical protein